MKTSSSQKKFYPVAMLFDKKTMSLRFTILNGLRSEAEGNIAKAKANVEVYLNNPAGIGEHPDVLGAIQEQLDLIAHEEERIEVLDKYFNS